MGRHIHISPTLRRTLDEPDRNCIITGLSDSHTHVRAVEREGDLLRGDIRTSSTAMDSADGRDAVESQPDVVRPVHSTKRIREKAQRSDLRLGGLIGRFQGILPADRRSPI